jgi:SAM-dependent methyltransferase
MQAVTADVQPALRCPACSATAAAPSPNAPRDFEYAVTPSRPLGFLRCAECESERLDPLPSEEELLGFYPAGYHAYNDDHGWLATRLVALRARRRARYYAALVGGARGAVFDVGAGDCRHFLELARHHPFDFAGVELNPAMAAQARERGYDVTGGTLERMDLTRHVGRYDIVSMNHVLEHVLDPGEVLRRTHRLLKPGGHVVGQLPTRTSWEADTFGGRWAGYHYPRHVHVFSRAGLIALLRTSGFEAVRISSAPHIQIALSLQNVLVERGLGGRLRFGRAWYFPLLMLACLPLEVAIAACNRSGVIDFEARRA